MLQLSTISKRASGWESFRVLTAGILLPYWVYWSAKYFFDRLEIEIPDSFTDPL